MDSPDYLSVCQAARILGVSPESVRRRISRGQLRAVKDVISGRFRLAWSDVMGQLEEVRGGQAATVPPHSPRPLSPQARAVLGRLGLLEFLPPGG